MDGGCVNVLHVLLMERECDVAIATQVSTVRSAMCIIKNVFYS